MSITFNADEVFEMAEQIERNGAKFYRKAASQSCCDESKKMLLGLAEMEDRHEKTFISMRKELSDAEKAPTVFDPDDQIGLYLRALADGHVFDVNADPSAKLTGTESLADVLTKAIDLERDSVVFYVGIKTMVPARLGAEWIEGIIREEMGHIALLSRQRKGLA